MSWGQRLALAICITAASAVAGRPAAATSEGCAAPEAVARAMVLGVAEHTIRISVQTARPGTAADTTHLVRPGTVVDVHVDPSDAFSPGVTYEMPIYRDENRTALRTFIGPLCGARFLDGRAVPDPTVRHGRSRTWMLIVAVASLTVVVAAWASAMRRRHRRQRANEASLRLRAP